jgi:hypothetical protein
MDSLMRSDAGREHHADAAAGSGPILFLHIPKTAGSTLSQVLYRTLHADELGKSEGDAYHEGLYYITEGFHKHDAPSIPRNIVRALGRGDIRGVLGHFSFGVHRHTRPGARYLTIVREPVGRVVSLWRHLQPGVSLTEFASEGLSLLEVDNDQARRIAGVDPPFGHCDESLLEIAKRNIEEWFLWTGLTERFDLSLLALSRLMGWDEAPEYLPKLINRSRGSRPSRSEIERVRELNWVDQRLYEFVEQRLLGQAQKLMRDADADLATYQARLQRHHAVHAGAIDTMGLG